MEILIEMVTTKLDLVQSRAAALTFAEDGLRNTVFVLKRCKVFMNIRESLFVK